MEGVLPQLGLPSRYPHQHRRLHSLGVLLLRRSFEGSSCLESRYCHDCFGRNSSPWHRNSEGVPANKNFRYDRSFHQHAWDWNWSDAVRSESTSDAAGRMWAPKELITSGSLYEENGYGVN